MLSRLSPLLVAAALVPMAVAPLHAEDVSVTVDTDEVLHTVDPKVYGHFYEHIYHSANGGLWGNVVWNRSFEQSAEGSGLWEIEGDVLRQLSTASGVTAVFGDEQWKDIDYTLQARKMGGAEGFLIPFNVAGDDDYYWLNLGGWGNTQHGLERGVSPARRETAAERVSGRIEEGRWYDIRLRTEGDRVQAWLDGEQVFDETLEDDTPRGQVGVGTWGTRAEFRNLKVTDLEGKTLHEGLPERPRSEKLAQNWDIVEGHAGITSENPLNDEVAAKLEAGTTIEQPHVKFNDHDPLDGSIWLRGQGKVTVRALGDDGEVLAEQEVTGLTEEWKEFPVTLSPSKDATEGKLQISAAGDVVVDQFNLLPQSASENDGFRTDLYDALAGLQPTIIRWPGGIYAEQYDWTRGVGPQHTRRKNFVPLWEDFDPNSLGTDEFMTLCEKLGAEPLLVINTGMHVTGTDSPEDWEPWLELALNWIEYCNGSVETEYGKMRAENGHPEPYNVTYWEIDNELWRSQRTDPQTYAEAVKYFAPKMREKGRELGTELIILAHGGNGADRRYNQVLLDEAAEHFDILSIHHYMDPNRFDNGVEEQEALYQDMRQRVADSDNPDIELYVSEWNAQSTDWRTGLYAGGLLNAFERQGDFLTIGGPALLMREHTAGAWDNAFINFKQDAWYPAPNYVVMKLWREHYAPDLLKLEGELQGTNIVATRSEDGQTVYLKAVNPTDEPMTVTAELEGDFEPGAAEMQLVAPGELSARNTFEAPAAVKPEPAPAELEGETVTFDLPPYSAGVVTLKAE